MKPNTTRQLRLDWADQETCNEALQGISAIYFIAPRGLSEPVPLVAVFLDDAAHDTAHIPTGPAALTCTDAADILTRLTGHTVRRQSVSEEEVASRIAQHGVPAAIGKVLTATDVAIAIADGDEDHATDTDTDERIASQPARSFSTSETKEIQ